MRTAAAICGAAEPGFASGLGPGSTSGLGLHEGAAGHAYSASSAPGGGRASVASSSGDASAPPRGSRGSGHTRASSRRAPRACSPDPGPEPTAAAGALAPHSAARRGHSGRGTADSRWAGPAGSPSAGPTLMTPTCAVFLTCQAQGSPARDSVTCSGAACCSKQCSQAVRWVTPKFQGKAARGRVSGPRRGRRRRAARRASRPRGARGAALQLARQAQPLRRAVQ